MSVRWGSVLVVAAIATLIAACGDDKKTSKQAASGSSSKTAATAKPQGAVEVQSFVQDVYDRYIAASPGEESRSVIAKASTPKFTEILGTIADYDRVLCAQNVPQSVKAGDAGMTTTGGYDVPVAMTWGQSPASKAVVHVVTEGDELRIDGVECSDMQAPATATPPTTSTDETIATPTAAKTFVQKAYSSYVSAEPEAGRTAFAKLSTPVFAAKVKRPVDIDPVLCAQNIPKTVSAGDATVVAGGFTVPVTMTWGASANSTVTVKLVSTEGVLTVSAVTCA